MNDGNPIKSVIAVLALSATLLAPGAQAGDERREEHRARMQVELGVTDEQMQQMHEIRRNGGSREDAAAVLTEEQRAQMRQWREENPEKAHKMNKHRDHHGSSAEQ